MITDPSPQRAVIASLAAPNLCIAYVHERADEDNADRRTPEAEQTVSVYRLLTSKEVTKDLVDQEACTLLSFSASDSCHNRRNSLASAGIRLVAG